MRGAQGGQAEEAEDDRAEACEQECSLGAEEADEHAAGAERGELGGVAGRVVGGEGAAVGADGTRCWIRVRRRTFLMPWPMPPMK